jgi:hypothetical protein
MSSDERAFSTRREKVAALRGTLKRPFYWLIVLGILLYCALQSDYEYPFILGGLGIAMLTARVMVWEGFGESEARSERPPKAK